MKTDEKREYRSSKRPAEHALPTLNRGGYFMLQPELRKPNSRKATLRMRLFEADGSQVSGAWNYAKVRLDRLAKLKEGRSKDGHRVWRLRVLEE
ncbi:MAG: hypothetical protein ACO3FL_04420 [Ilumatobacteraceae bacterium]